jgi:Tfp pilus assembly protein PilF
LFFESNLKKEEITFMKSFQIRTCLWIIVVLFVFAASPIFARDREDSIEKQVQNARGLINKGQYSEAEKLCTKIIQQDPKNVKAYSLRGYANDKLGKRENAVLDYSRAIDIDPGRAVDYNNRGATYGDLGKYDLAKSDLDKAIELDPKLATAYYNRAKIDEKTNQTDLALNDYRTAAELGDVRAQKYLETKRSNLAFARKQVGAGVSGFSFSAGYNGAQLNYSETNPNGGGVLDKDTGWLNGATVEAKYDGVQFPFFVRANFDYLTSSSATYDGGIQNPVTQNVKPLTTSISETIYKTEFNVGYKVWNPEHFTLAPYLGIGYRDWERGQDALPIYKESYTWWYGTIGANLAYRVTDRVLVGLDAALLVPFNPQMQTSIASRIDTKTFNLESQIGYRIQVPVSYDIYKGKEYKISTFLTPYYEWWNVGKSSVETVTQGGVPVGNFLEPTNNTDLYGFKIGLGVNF